MTKRQIRKLLQLEQQLDQELNDAYTDSMLELFPMIDSKSEPIPTKRKMILHVDQIMRHKYPQLRNSKILSSIISRFVSKKYEVKK